jgi:Tol biopolymer transport system component
VELTRGSGIGIVNIWSPDSQYLAYTESGDIYIMDYQGRGQVRVFHDLDLDGLIAWLP